MTAEWSDTSKGNINGMYLEGDARTSYYIKHRLKTHYGFFFCLGFFGILGFVFGLCNQTNFSVKYSPLWHELGRLST